MGGNKTILQEHNERLAALVETVTDLPDAGVGGSLPSANTRDVNFYDYNGTLLYSYTVAEAMALTQLPPLPSHDGLTCRGWNYTLTDIRSGENRDIGAMYTTNDGKTRVYITLYAGRTSPKLGCCPNGTVTVDWGDGTTPDVLTGTSVTVVQWTPNHEYAEPGDYVITLTVNGSMGFYGNSSANQYSGILRHSADADTRNAVYQSAVRCVQIGAGITTISVCAFRHCVNLTSITIPDTVTGIADYVFADCGALTYVTIPNGITSMGTNLFNSCVALYTISIPNTVTTIGGYAFRYCDSLSHISIPKSITSISTYMFNGCTSLARVIIPGKVTSISAYSFGGCAGVRFFDFSEHTTVPSMSSNGAFSGISEDSEIRVPASLTEQWKTDTNWSKYADNIVGV